MTSLCRNLSLSGYCSSYRAFSYCHSLAFPLRLWPNNPLALLSCSNLPFPFRLLRHASSSQQICFCSNSSPPRPQMDLTSNAPGDGDLAHEFRFFRVYKDGRIHKTHPPIVTTPPSGDPSTGLRCKDVVISDEPPVSARIYLPQIVEPPRRLPLLFYVHGGGFCFESAFSPTFHAYLSELSVQANAVAVSVEYGLFPDRPIPACYEDSWSALRWVSSHADGNGPEAWLNEHADLGRVFVGGDSAGGNISHNLGVRVGSIGLPGVKLSGLVLVHPYFGGTDDDHMWLYMCPGNAGLHDPRLRPPTEDLNKITSGKVLVFLAGKDHLKGVGERYCEDLEKSGWKGTVEIVEHEEVEHCFHVHDLTSAKAVDLVTRFVSFIKQN